MAVLLELYFTFLKIGLFSVGGGLASIPFIQEFIVEDKGWITATELLDIIGIAESTPGPIGINVATFVGNKIDGFAGGIVAVAGIVTPSLIIIIIIAHYFKKFSEKQAVKGAFYGIRPVVAGLIGAAGFEVAKVTLFNINNSGLAFLNIPAIALFGFTLFAIQKFNKHPILYIGIGALVGIILG